MCITSGVAHSVLVCVGTAGVPQYPPASGYWSLSIDANNLRSALEATRATVAKWLGVQSDAINAEADQETHEPRATA